VFRALEPVLPAVYVLVCDRCGLPLDEDEDPAGKVVVTQLGRWCRGCEETAL
jgi:hypothetical protein